MPPSWLIINLKVKIGYMFQPARWLSAGLITNVIGRNLKFAVVEEFYSWRDQQGQPILCPKFSVYL
jgi:hypothetical protein